MPPTNAVNTGGGTMPKERMTAAEIGVHFTNAFLILIVVLFVLFSLWVEVFAIPVFFVFFRAAVVTVGSARQGVNTIQGTLTVMRPLSFQSLRLGTASGLVLTVLAGGLTVFGFALLKFYALDGDTEDVFVGVFQILAAILFTHMAISVMQQGSGVTRSMSYFTRRLEISKDTEGAGPERSQMFYLGLGASLREGMESYLYMLPVGAAYDAQLIPIPAVLGIIAGLLAARYLIPAMVWGVVDERAIAPDSGAKTWATRREQLTNQYVSRLAAQAKGQPVEDDLDDDVGASGRPSLVSGSPENSADFKSKNQNLSALDADALQDLFKDSNIDPAELDSMDYAQKRLLVLKTSRALMNSDSFEDSEEDGPEPAIFSAQNSHLRGDSHDWDVSSQHSMPEGPPGLVAAVSGSGGRALFHRKGDSLVSIVEDEDGYIDRGGYSYDASDYQGSVAGHSRAPSALRRTGSHRSKASFSSVRFQDPYVGDDDDTRSVMTGFEHRYLSRTGARDTRSELEVMEATLTKSVMSNKKRRDEQRAQRSNGSMMRLKPGSPTLTAPRAPSQGSAFVSRHHAESHEELGGNMALGSQRSHDRSKRSSRFTSHRQHKSSATVSDMEAGGEEPNVPYYDMEEMEGKSVFASICLGISAFVVFLCCAGLFKMGVIGIKDVLSDSDGSTIFDICDCCDIGDDGEERTVTEKFFAIFHAQFGYTCAETLTGLLSWVCYWVYPLIVFSFAARMCCFSSIPTKDAPEMAAAPTRRQGAARAGFSAKSTKRFANGKSPDPAKIGRHPTHVWIKISAILNVISGAAYLWWRAVRSMPDDPVSPVWNWLFFAGEVILTCGVWTSHLQRSFPSIRDLCAMDDLVEIDSNVANEATVCIMVPTAGEKMKNVKHVLLGAYSQRLWASTVSASRQLRIAVLDEKGRHEVRDLVEKVYKLAEILCDPVVQSELCSKFDEPFITAKIFMDYFNQMDALDKFVFSKEVHPAFDIALRIENYTGLPTNKLTRASSSSGAKGVTGKSKAKVAKGRLDEGFKQLFDSTPTIPSMIYSARKSPGTPKVSPKAGNMNAAIFPNSPGEEPVIGDAARIVVVNDARHRLKTDFLQRTVPYFFRLDERTRKKYFWSNVGYVQTPQRFEDLGDGDPLGNHAVLTFFVSNVSKDGVGGVTSCGQGSLWRVDALRGMAADGRQTVDSVATPDIIGHDCGFRAEVLIEDTHTSLEFFKLQWRSAYVCEPGETLAVCVEQPNTVAWRVKQVFRWHIGAVQLLLKDGVAFLCTSNMPTILHKMFGLDSLTYYIQAVGGFFIILMPIMFSIFQETPFNTRDLQFLYFFFPYIVTATIPTILAVGWKNVNPNRVLTDEQFWLATCYVQIWAFALGVWNRITCANPDNAWNLKCPTWPLGLLFFALGISAVNTTAHWAYTGFDSDEQWIFFASFGACLVVMYGIWPMFKLWWPGWVALPSVYHAKFVAILVFIAVTSVLATYL